MNPDNHNTTSNLPKSLPYKESDSYIDSLVNRCTEQALARRAMAERSRQRPQILRRRIVGGVAAAAVAGIVGTVAWHEAHRPSVTHPAPDSTHLAWQAMPEQVAEQDPIDALLNTLSADELLQIDEPCPDEIPEY
ncbi:MAG: hypothetical protein IJ632_03665 [Muribaculaceae bacterium]|nr:hypothetical protein [Muribaculaceae bacterium]